MSEPTVGRRRSWPAAVAAYLGRLVAALAAILGLMVGLGLLVTGPLARAWPFISEDQLVRSLAAGRSPAWNTVTDAVDDLANTAVVVLSAVLVVAALRLAVRRWLEPLIVAAAVAGQSGVFLATTLAIDRLRPDVSHLDPAPPTSSFPSGHTGAAAALYVSTALVLARRARATAVGWLLPAVAILVPLAVGAARLYRGMHHPSDVAAGLLNGLLCTGASAFAVRAERRTPSPP